MSFDVIDLQWHKNIPPACPTPSLNLLMTQLSLGSSQGQEIQRLLVWCPLNNVKLNTSKTKQIIPDFRIKWNTNPAWLCINWSSVERVQSFRFLGVFISKDPRVPDFLRVLRMNNKLLVAFYRPTIESTLTYCISIWYAGCSAADKKAPQRVVKSAEKKALAAHCPAGRRLPPHATSAEPTRLSETQHTPVNIFLNRCPLASSTGRPKTRTSRFRASFFSQGHVQTKHKIPLRNLYILLSTHTLYNLHVQYWYLTLLYLVFIFISPYVIWHIYDYKGIHSTFVHSPFPSLTWLIGQLNLQDEEKYVTYIYIIYGQLFKRSC